MPFVSNLAWRKIKLIPRGFYVNCMLKGSASLSSSTFSASRRVEDRGPPDPGRAHFAAKKVQSVAQRMRLGMPVSAFANCGRAIAHVRGSYGQRTHAPQQNNRTMKPSAANNLSLWCVGYAVLMKRSTAKALLSPREVRSGFNRQTKVAPGSAAPDANSSRR